LGLDQTASGDEDVLLGRRLNEGVLQVLLETHCYQAQAYFGLVASTQDYDLQGGTNFQSSLNGSKTANTVILAIDRLIDSNNIPLIRVDPEEIYDLRRASSTSSSSQRMYAVNGNMLMVWPSPSSSESLTMYYVPRPTEMSSGSHDPSNTTYGGIPAEWHRTLEFYALWAMASYDDDASSGIGDKYFGQYQVWLGKMKKSQRLRGGRRQAPVRVAPHRPRPSSDPSRT